jgi:hypothetical protein
MPLKSHAYNFTPTGLATVAGPPFAVVLLISGLLHLAGIVGLLPGRRSVQDMDHTVLSHQIHASGMPASIALIGDSSCLMDVSGRLLGQELQRPVSNLGTMSLLDLAAFASLASNAVSATTGSATVVLLVHPDFLMRPAADPRMLGDFQSMRQRVRPAREPEEPSEWVASILALDLFRESIESTARSFPLSGDFGRRYGFTEQISAAIDQDLGLVDPRRYRFVKKEARPFEVSPRLESQFRALRGQLPPNVGLEVGITPVPESEGEADFGTRHSRALETLSDWIGGEVRILTDLPALLPDSEFATRTHLSQEGRLRFTGLLAKDLSAKGTTR